MDAKSQPIITRFIKKLKRSEAEIISAFMEGYRYTTHGKYILFASETAIMQCRIGAMASDIMTKLTSVWGVFDTESFYVYILTPYVFDLSFSRSPFTNNAAQTIQILLNILVYTSAPVVLLKDGSGAGRIGLFYDILAEIANNEKGESPIEKLKAKIVADYGETVRVIDEQIASIRGIWGVNEPQGENELNAS